MQIIDKIILGTVQLGCEYGINNTTGMQSLTDRLDILKFASTNNILFLDTADAYGDATKLIGEFHKREKRQFSVITKFKNFNNILDFESWIDQAVIELGIDRLYGCLFHNFDDYILRPDVVSKLCEMKNREKIEYVGVSVYTNEQLERVIEDDNIKLIQLPFNLLDNFSQRGELIKLAKNKGKLIHTRSVFLQGLFFMDINSIPEKLQPLKSELITINKLAKDNGISIESLALNYVLSNPFIDGVLVGVDNKLQLQRNLEAMATPLSTEVINSINEIRVRQTDLLSPTNW